MNTEGQGTQCLLGISPAKGREEAGQAEVALGPSDQALDSTPWVTGSTAAPDSSGLRLPALSAPLLGGTAGASLHLFQLQPGDVF